MTKARDLANAGTALTNVSATELGYLDGVTSAIQTQFNNQTKSFLISKESLAYYGTPASVALSNRTAVVNTTYYQPIYLDGNATFDRIAIRTGSSFSGSGTVRLGIYNASSTTGKPTTVYLDAGTVSPVSANAHYQATINSTPPAGYYYLAFNLTVAATTNTFLGFGNGEFSTISIPYAAVGINWQNNPTAYNAYTESVNASSGFATAGTLTSVRLEDVTTVKIRFS